MSDSPKIQVRKNVEWKRTSDAAKASLIFGILTWLGGPLAHFAGVRAGAIFSGMSAVLGLLCGWIAMKSIRQNSMIHGKQLVVVGMSLSGPLPIVALAVILPVTWYVRAERDQAVTRVNLGSIGLAVHHWADLQPLPRAFPAAGTVERNSNYLISWRYAIVSYVGDHRRLADQFEWSDEPLATRYSTLVNSMPPEYRSQNQDGPAYQTVYLAVISDGKNPDNPYPTLFNHDGFPIEFTEVPDGTSNTVMVVEADNDQAVTWTEPKDWLYDPNNPKRGLGKMRQGKFQALMADGSVRMISTSADNKSLCELFQRNDQKGSVTPVLPDHEP